MASTKARSRELDRNNPHASGGIDSYVTNLIGRGMTPRWNTGNPALDAKILDLWKLSVSEMDASICELDFYGLQTLAATAMVMSGDVLGQFVYRPYTSTLNVPVQLKLLENDHLYDQYDQMLPNGNSLRMGFEINPAGEKVACHVYPQHPGDGFTDASNLLPVRIPIEDTVFLYQPRRPGQLRGMPWLSSVIAGLRSIDEYDDAERIRKKIAAMYAGFITSPPGDPELSGLPGLEEDYDDEEDLVALEPGLMQGLKPGEDIEWSKPADVGENFQPWMKHNLRRIAKALKITYEQLTGDLEGVTYSSIRAGLVEIYRQCRAIQGQILVHKFCRPITTRWLDIAVASGRIFIPRYYKNRRVIVNNIWDPDGWDWVDPLKDVQAAILEIRGGLTSRSRSVGERGSNAAEIDSENAADNIRADDAGIIYDSDPRKTTQSGGNREKGESNAGQQPKPKPED
jgi:lambda family phage portal protein